MNRYYQRARASPDGRARASQDWKYSSDEEEISVYGSVILQAATATITPSSGPVGTMFTVSIVGLLPNSPYTYDVWNNTNNTIVLAFTSFTTDANGNATLTFTSTTSGFEGNTYVGTCWISVFDSSGAYAINMSNPFVVTPQTVLSPQVTLSELVGLVGDTIDFDCSGFAPNSVLTVIDYTQNTTLTLPQSITTDSTGAASSSFVVTQNMLGSNTLSVTDASGNNATVSFLIQVPVSPQASSDETAYFQGETISVSCSQFPANTTIYAIGSSGNILGSITTNGSGSGVIQYNATGFGSTNVTISPNSSNPTSVQYATITYYVTKSVISINKSQYTLGDMVDWTVVGYLPNSQLKVIQSIGSVSNDVTGNPIPVTDGSGNASGQFLTTSDMIGSDVVEVQDSIGSTATANFTVTSGSIIPSLLIPTWAWIALAAGAVIVILMIL